MPDTKQWVRESIWRYLNSPYTRGRPPGLKSGYSESLVPGDGSGGRCKYFALRKLAPFTVYQIADPNVASKRIAFFDTLIVRGRSTELAFTGPGQPRGILLPGADLTSRLSSGWRSGTQPGAYISKPLGSVLLIALLIVPFISSFTA